MTRAIQSDCEHSLTYTTPHDGSALSNLLPDETLSLLTTLAHSYFPGTHPSQIYFALRSFRPDTESILHNGKTVLGMTRSSIAGIEALVRMIDAFPAANVNGSIVDALTRDPKDIQRFQRFVAAVTLDSALSHMEGRNVRFPTSDRGLARFIAISEALTAASPDPRRTALGFYTDDTQFLLSGTIESTYGTDNFTTRLQNRWRNWGKLRLWRNIGERTAAFLNGNRTALSGQARLGDILRLSPFLTIANLSTRAALIQNYIREMRLNTTQSMLMIGMNQVFDFLCDGKNQDASYSLQRLINQLSSLERNQEDRTILIHVLQAINTSLIGQSSITHFFTSVSPYIRDWDTLGFIAGLFHPNPSIALEHVAPLLTHIPERGTLLALITSSIATQNGSDQLELHSQALHSYQNSMSNTHPTDVR